MENESTPAVLTKYRKFIVAGIAAVLYFIAAGVIPEAAEAYVQGVIIVLGTLGVYIVPNDLTKPEDNPYKK